MAAGDIALNILISAHDGASGIIGAIGGKLAGMAMSGGGLGMVAGAGVAAGVAIAGIGVAAAKAAGDFQQSMSQLITSAGESKANIDLVSKGILQMSMDTGTSTQQLGQGMYYVESAGFHGADGIKVMTAAAQGAKSENADLATVTKTLTTLMTDYHMSASDSTKAMDGLIATVKNGKTNLQDLASSMGAVLPIASAMGISFPQVAGAMDTMTNAGMSSRQAAQNLAHVLVALESPSGVAVKSMKAVGLSSQEVKDALVNQGLPEALQLIEDHVGAKFPKSSVEYETALKNIMGGIVGLKLAAMLTGDSLQTTKNNIQAVSEAMGKAGKTVDGFDTVQGNLNFQLDRVNAAFQALMIVLGQKLLPVVTPVVKGFADFLETLVKLIGGIGETGTATDKLTSIFQQFGVSSKTLQQIGQALGVTWSYLKDIFGQIGQAIMSAMQAGVKSAGDFMNSLPGVLAVVNGLLHTIDELIGPIIHLAEAINGVLNQAIQMLTSYMGGHLQEQFGTLGQAVGNLDKSMGSVAKTIDGMATQIGKLGPVLEQVGKFLADTFDPLWIALQKAIDDLKPTWDDMVKSFQESAPEWQEIAKILGGTVILNLEALAKLLAGALYIALLLVTASLKNAMAVVTAFNMALKDVGDSIQIVIDAFNATAKAGQDAGNATKKFFEDLWKTITKDAEEAWKAIQKAWGDIGKWFQDRGKDISKAFQDAWAWVKQAAADTWNAIKSAAKTAWDGIVNSVVAPIHAIGDAFKWLYDHNYYFKDLVDFIHQKFDDLLKWSQQTWNTFTKWLSGIWQGISKEADKDWKAVSETIVGLVLIAVKAVQDKWNDFSKWLGGLWQGLVKNAEQAWQNIANPVMQKTQEAIKGAQQHWDEFKQWLGGLWDATVKKASDAWGAIGAIFSNAWQDHILPGLQALGQNISQWWSDRVKDAENLGKNFIEGIAKGIAEGAGAVGKAIHDAMSTALSALGFHDIPGFANGVQNFTGGWAVVGERGPELLFLPRGSSVIPSGSPPPVVSSVASSASGSDQPMVIYNVLDGKVISKVVTKYQTAELRIQGQIRSA